ncbi:MAG: Ppx/GppA phosphatase family protein [Cyanobacteria bacterium P01_A01_bin.135]
MNQAALTHTSATPATNGHRSPRTIAAIDVGTNSIHLVVAQIQPELPSFQIIAKEKDTVRLGDRDPKTGNLTEAAMERGIKALRRCRDLATSMNAEDIAAVATSAVREAPNGSEFIQRVEQQLGLAIDLISGEEEARRIYLGVLSGMELGQKPHVVIDIGGGSTELILGDGHEPRFLSSTKVGAVRLSREFVRHDPPAEAEVAYLKAFVHGKLERSVEELQYHLQPNESIKLVGTSGTIEALATIHACETMGAVPATLNGYRVPFDDLKAIIKRLQNLKMGDRRSLPGLSERRAEIIIAGALVLQEAMALLKADAVTVCERALREGVVVDWMLTQGLIADRLAYQSSVRQRSVFNLARKYQINLEHSGRVARFALSLFDQAQQLGLHDWQASDRELLWVGAMLHNCGHFVSHNAHHKHSYYLVRHGGLLGFTEVQIEAIANIARYHRKSHPKKKHENYRNLPNKEWRQRVNQLSAILRVAIALDRRQIGAIRQLHCELDTDEPGLILRLQPSIPGDPCSLELWSLDYKKDCFEAEFGYPVIPALEG